MIIPFVVKIAEWQYSEGEMGLIKPFLNKEIISGMTKRSNEDIFWPHQIRIDGIRLKLPKKHTAARLINEIKHNEYPI